MPLHNNKGFYMTYDILDKSTEFSRDFEVDPKLTEGVNKKTLLNKTIDFLHEELNETNQAIKDNNMPEMIDGFGDVAFVALNGIYKIFRLEGYAHILALEKSREVMRRICEANLGKKQTDGSIKYLNGKVQKPANWSAPIYDDLLES
jgi:hypothetical protein